MDLQAIWANWSTIRKGWAGKNEAFACGFEPRSFRITMKEREKAANSAQIRQNVAKIQGEESRKGLI